MAVHQVPPLISPADLTNKTLLDSGSFGHDIYCCRHKTHGLVLAKMVYTGPQHSQSMRRSLLKEVESLLKLNHNRIARVLGVALDDRASYLVMQLVPKGNLLGILDKVTVPISIKGTIILDILEGMVYLTNSGIIHKDLKPENILVYGDFRIKIADLGLASCQAWSKLTWSRKQSRKSGSSTAVTLFYMAPEHLQNINAHFTEKSDVYSFAIIVWVILTNQEPYGHCQGDHVISGVCNGSRPDDNLIPHSSPVMMVTLMKKCWVQDPAKRPTFAESYESFQHFYRDELEKRADKDLQSLMGQTEIVNKMSSLAQREPIWQTDSVEVQTSVEDPQSSQEGLRFESLQTDAIPVRHSRAPHGSFVSSPDLSVPPTLGHQHSVRSQANSSPGLYHPQANVTMRERKSEGVHGPEATPQSLDPPNRTRSWPVFPDREAPNQGAGDYAHMLFRQCSAAGVYIQNATAVQIGDNNHLTIGSQDSGEDSFQPHTSEYSHYEELLRNYEDHSVRRGQLDLLSKNIGRNWKCCARSLGLTNTEVETIGYDFTGDGLTEMVHQMLEKWQMKRGIVGCTVGELCRALRDNVSVDLLYQVLLMCQAGATP